MKKEKKTLIITIVTVLILIVMIVGVTYAYFSAQVDGSESTQIDVQTKTTDSLVFSTEPEDTIGFTANQSNYAEGMGSQQSKVTAKVELTANNAATEEVVYDYYLYLRINDNNFEYTTSDKKPELVLTITDVTNNEVITSVEGLTPTTVTTTIDGEEVTLTGFDITNESAKPIAIKVNEEIATLTTEEHKYEFTITLINLDTDQMENMGKVFNAEVIIQDSALETQTLATKIKSLYTTDGGNGLYLHDGSGTYTNADLEAGDGSYRYAGGNVNNYVCFGSDEATCPVDSLYRIIGVFGTQVKLMKAEYATSEMLGSSGVGDYAKQYSEAEYDKSYYRGSVALADIGAYYWNNNTTSTGKNHWKESLLNKTNLNTNYVAYLNEIDTKWMGYIADTIWYVAGMSEYHNQGVDQETGLDNNAKTTYDWEVGDYATKEGEYTSTDNSTEEAKYTDGKIGLIYVSDYMYAEAPEYWDLPGYTDNGSPNQDGAYGPNYDYKKGKYDNWMYLGLIEWTISRSMTHDSRALLVHSAGDLRSWYLVYGHTFAVRPTFNLATTVNFAYGVGSEISPYRIF